MNFRCGTAAALAFTFVACAGQSAPVPATLDPVAKTLLTGEWTGTYESPAKERNGYITFELEQDVDSTVCRGDVLMVPKATGQPVRPVAGHEVHRDNVMRIPRLLAIESIRVTGDRITGRIEPYSDPETMHPVRTSFEGRITGDTIRGTLSSIDEQTGDRISGTWTVTRTKRQPAP